MPEGEKIKGNLFIFLNFRSRKRWEKEKFPVDIRTDSAQCVGGDMRDVFVDFGGDGVH